MSYTGTKENVAPDNTSPAEAKVGPTGPYTITVYAVDANDDFEAVGSGTADLKMKTPGSSQWETVFKDDGTTPVSFDVKASEPQSVVLANVSASMFQTNPNSLTSGKKLRIAVAFG